MRKRIGFTLIELLIVMAIILTMASILLVTVNHVRRVAAIDGEKLDFQAIQTALENYRNDFGSYPRNIQLTTWQVAATVPPPAPVFLSLATALLGPGPGSPQLLGSPGVFTAGDGADGPGIRTQTMNMPASASSSAITFTPPLSIAPSYTPGQSVCWFDEEQVTNGVTVHTLYGIQGLTSVTSSSATVTGWSYGASSPPSGSGILRIASGRVWGPYLPAERFQVAYVDSLRAAGSTSNNQADALQPVLLDRWGGVIQYFPAYGPMNNRLSVTSAGVAASSYTLNHGIMGTLTLPAPIVAGPLFGFSAPSTIDMATPTISAPEGAYSIFDQRDGAPVIDISNPNLPATYTWQGQPSATHPDLTLAVKWMLGDDNFDNFIGTYTDAGGNQHSESLRDTQPYILISAGPDGPIRTYSGFCDFSQIPATTDSGVYQKAFTASGNIYNFDR
jgi:prepilin-type N-terminal cleavage/methylation domain-containing protein